MTDEELKYLKALKSEIDKRLGPIQWNDALSCPKGLIVLGGLCCRRLGCRVESQICFTEPFIRIPHPMPMPGVPKDRTLWGWIDWSKYSQFVTGKGILWIRDEDGSTVSYDSPYLALLKAFAKRTESEKYI